MAEGGSLPGIDPADPRPLRYRRAAGVLLQRETAADRDEYLLRLPGGQVFALGEHERYLWISLDGTKSFAAIDDGFRARFGMPLARAGFEQFLAELLAAGAIDMLSATGGRVRRVGLPAPAAKRIQLDIDGTAPAEAEQTRAGARPGAGRPDFAPRPGGDGAPWRRGRRNDARQRPPAKQRRIGVREAMRRIWVWRLGDPDRLFAALASFFWPIRQICWLLVPCVIMGFLISFEHWNNYWADWGGFFPLVPQWPVLWAAEHFTTWTGKIAEATVIYGFGGTIRRVDIKLFMGLFIRVHYEETTVGSLPRRERLWIAASTILWRLFCWSFFMVLWFMFRSTHQVLADIAAVEAFMGFASFLFVICPLIPLYGYKFLEVLVGDERLWGRSIKYFLLTVRGRAGPAAYMTLPQRSLLMFMGIGVMIGCTYFIGNMMYHADTWTIQNFGGLGATIAIVHTSFCGVYFYRVKKLARQPRQAGVDYDRQEYSVQPEL